MSGDPSGFVPQFERLLGVQQQRTMLATIGRALPSETTLGEIIDAAATLGWSQGVGELRLVDLAEALLREPAADDDAQSITASNDEPVAVVAEAPARKKTTAKAASKAASKKVAAKKTAKPTKRSATGQAMAWSAKVGRASCRERV